MNNPQIPILFPYIANVKTKSYESVNDEEIIKYQEFQISCNVRFRDKSKKIIIITKKNNFINFNKCEITLNTSRNNYKNIFYPYKIIEDIDIIKIFCKMEEL